MPQVIERRISFNGGELSPWTDPRIDLEKYRSGCRTLENFRPTLYGGAFSRPGTVYVASQSTPGEIGRVVSFEFSATTSLALVFSNELLEVWTTGATPTRPTVTSASIVSLYEDAADAFWQTATPFAKGQWIWNISTGLPYYCLVSHTSGTFATDLAAGKWQQTANWKMLTPYPSEDLAGLQFAQTNDLLYISHPNHAPRVLKRNANNAWTLEILELEYPPLRDSNITPTTLTASATTGTATITASEDIFNAGHVGSRWVIRHRRDDPSVELLISAAVNSTSPSLFVLGEWSLAIVAGQGTASWTASAIVERSTDGSTWETIRTLSASRQDQSSLITGTEIEPAFLRVKMLSKVGTTPTNGAFTLEAVDPDHYGIFEITSFFAADSVGASVIFPLGGTTATDRWQEAAWSGFRGWPRAVCLHEGRLFFGGNEAQPQTVWGSIVDDYANFRTGSEDDVGLAFTLSGEKANAVQWLVSQETLIVGTAGAEGPMGPRETDKAMTPTNTKKGRFTQTGSEYIQALAVQDAVIFIQRSGRKAWEFAFAFESDGFKANDLTLLAEHITDSPIVGIAHQKRPDSILWAVTASGELLGLAYDRSQNVAGWFRYVTDGSFESVAVTPGSGEEDQVWVTVARNINGSATRYVERFQPDRLRMLKDGDTEHLCCADAALIYDGSPVSSVSGLSHLEGETVAVVADGVPLTARAVSGGSVALDVAASVVVVGLPFTATLEPTFLETGDPASLSKVAWKRIHRAQLEVWKSVGCEVTANDGATWETVEFREQGQAMDAPIALFTGYREVHVESNSERQATVKVRQTQPLPLNLMSLHIRHEMNQL